jgi:hypothetical protein
VMNTDGSGVRSVLRGAGPGSWVAGC